MIPQTTALAVEYNTRIREMPATDRPRERLRAHGAESLSNAELLAILLRTGAAGQSVLSLATGLLSRHGGLGGLARLSFSELVSQRGLGEAKAAELRALFTLAGRLRALEAGERPIVRSPADIMAILGAEMSVLEQEHLRVVLLTTRNQVIATPEVYKGNVNSSLVRIAEVFKEPIRQNAPSIVLVHNHPSGDPSPSADDVLLTGEVIKAGKLMGIEVLDHVIVGEGRHCSLKEMGLAFGA